MEIFDVLKFEINVNVHKGPFERVSRSPKKLKVVHSVPLVSDQEIADIQSNYGVKDAQFLE